METMKINESLSDQEIKILEVIQKYGSYYITEFHLMGYFQFQFDGRIDSVLSNLERKNYLLKGQPVDTGLNCPVYFVSDKGKRYLLNNQQDVTEKLEKRKFDKTVIVVGGVFGIVASIIGGIVSAVATKFFI